MIIEGVTYPLVHSHTLHLADSSNDLSPSITSSAYIIHRTTSSTTTTTAVKQEGGGEKIEHHSKLFPLRITTIVLA